MLILSQGRLLCQQVKKIHFSVPITRWSTWRNTQDVSSDLVIGSLTTDKQGYVQVAILSLQSVVLGKNIPEVGDMYISKTKCKLCSEHQYKEPSHSLD